MLTRETITVGHRRFRVSPWHAADGVALLSLPVDQSAPTADEVSRALEVVRSRGCSAVMTSALNEADAAAFVALGFVEDGRLHVLEHRFGPDTPPPGRNPAPGGARLRRGRRSDRTTALELDRRAFPEMWRLDAGGLADAMAATPSARFRIAEAGGVPVGYSVTGRGGTTGFLQRLATDPDHRRMGIGSGLVRDSLGWCARRGCERVLVNTQVTNTAALALYDTLGFTRLPDDLVVLSWSDT